MQITYMCWAHVYWLTPTSTSCVYLTLVDNHKLYTSVNGPLLLDSIEQLYWLICL